MPGFSEQSHYLLNFFGSFTAAAFQRPVCFGQIEGRDIFFHWGQPYVGQVGAAVLFAHHINRALQNIDDVLAVNRRLLAFQGI